MNTNFYKLNRKHSRREIFFVEAKSNTERLKKINNEIWNN